MACAQQGYCKLLYEQMFAKKSMFAAAQRAAHGSMEQSIVTC